jgi:hypothetical protein
VFCLLFASFVGILSALSLFDSQNRTKEALGCDFFQALAFGEQRTSQRIGRMSGTIRWDCGEILAIAK